MVDLVNSYYFFRYVFVSTLLSMFLFGACKQKSPPKEYTKVKVGITSSFLGESATFIAKEKGFFRDQGLEVELIHNASGKESLMGLFREEVDIAHVAETPIVYTLFDSSYSEVNPVPSFQIFADMIYADEIQKITGRKDHDITEPQDIIGKKIAIFEDTQLDYYLDSFLLEHQIPKDSITLINLAPINHLEAIKEGEVDISVNWEPYASNILLELGENGITLETRLTYSTLWMATTLDSYAKQHPEVLMAYLKALKKAQSYIKKHPAEAQKLLSNKIDVPLPVVENLWPKIDFELSLSERMLILLEDQSRWLKHKNLSDTTNINFMDFINFSPMREVYPNGITVIQ